MKSTPGGTSAGPAPHSQGEPEPAETGGAEVGAAGVGATETVPAEPEAGPRWLSDEERAAWIANSAIMISLPAALDARMQRESRMTFFEYMVLSVLSERPDRTMQMSALATRTAASLSRLSHVVGRLEKNGLLSRSRIPGPGRRTNATLTDDGYARVVAAAPGHVAAVREFLIDGLEPRDLGALRRIGTAVEEAIGRTRTRAGSVDSGV